MQKLLVITPLILFFQPAYAEGDYSGIFILMVSAVTIFIFILLGVGYLYSKSPKDSSGGYYLLMFFAAIAVVIYTFYMVFIA